MGRTDYWEEVYGSRRTEELGWYAPRLQTSLSWIEAIGLEPGAPLLDVGGGASTLVDDLLRAGHRAVSVLDISDRALSHVRARLGDQAEQVRWLSGDITSVQLPTATYALWHDRAVFHFLITPDERREYQDRLRTALSPGGHLVIGVFALEAPPRCSGLPVQRYAPETLAQTLGDAFELVRHQDELHVTPGGVEQRYLYCHFRKSA